MPRHQYAPDEVALRVLSNDMLFRVCEMVSDSDGLVHASDISRRLGISVGHAYNLLKRLEKWRVLRGLKDPVNGKLGFRLSNSSAARLVVSEIRRRKAEELEKIIVERIHDEPGIYT